MAFKKYPSIENTYRNKEIAWWTSQYPEFNTCPNLHRECVTWYKQEIEHLEAQIDAIQEVICDGAPLAWARGEYINEAADWEKQLCDVSGITKLREEQVND